MGWRRWGLIAVNRWNRGEAYALSPRAARSFLVLTLAGGLALATVRVALGWRDLGSVTCWRAWRLRQRSCLCLEWNCPVHKHTMTPRNTLDRPLGIASNENLQH